MVFEATIKYKTTLGNGDVKDVRESFVFENEEFFADVEKKLYELYSTSDSDMSIISIKPSKIQEIANERQQTSDALWLAEVQDVFLQDDGTEKATKYKILFFAQSFDSANSFIRDYIRQGYDMKLVSLKETKFTEVL